MISGPSKTSAKRVGPRRVNSVIIGDVRYKAIHWGRERGFGQNGGYIAAVDVKTNKELWTLKVYDVDYEGGKEEDAQDVFIASMKADDGKLIIKDEDDRRYAVDVKTKAVKRL